MAILQIDDIADAIATTQRDLGKGEWTDLSSSLQDFVAMQQILTPAKANTFSGTGMQWNLMTGNSGAAHQTGLYATEAVNVADVMKNCYAPWRHTTTSYAFDRREFNANMGPAQVVDLVKIRRADAWVSLAEHCEYQMWNSPPSSSDENVWGIFSYVVYDNSATAGSFAFTSSLPSGFSDIAGASPTTYTRWRNGSAKYSSIDNSSASTNALMLIRKALRRCNFKGLPRSGAGAGQPVGEQRGIYCNSDTLDKLEFALGQQNDNLGNDAIPKFGDALINRIPVTYVPYMDLCNQNPIVGIDWSTFYPGFLEGEYLRETNFKPDSNQPTTFKTFVDMSWNLKCTNRRKQWIVSDSASALSFSAIPS